MAEDIVERLREKHPSLVTQSFIMAEAADEIERLRAEVAKFAAIRETHAIVPREPTEAMVRAGLSGAWASAQSVESENPDIEEAYCRMIAAAEGEG